MDTIEIDIEIVEPVLLEIGVEGEMIVNPTPAPAFIKGEKGDTGAQGPMSSEYLSPVFTIELMNFLSQDFYAPFNFKINTITNLVNSPTTTLAVNNSPYTLGNNITAGNKITATVSTAGVINLNTTRL